MLVAVVLCTAASMQEPPFFRLGGLDLAWPFIYAVADLWMLLCCLVPPAIEPWSFRTRLARAAGCGLTGAGGLVVVTAIGLLLDCAQALDTPWGMIAPFAARSLRFWIPLLLLAQAPALATSTQRRFLVLGIAFLVQSAVHPASLPSSTTVGQLLASALAVIGGFATMAKTHL